MNLEAVMQYMNVGGTFVIWALAACSVLVIGIFLERFFVMLRSGVDGDWLLKQVALFVSRDRLSDAVLFCANRKWLLANVFKAGLSRSHLNREDILDGMSTSISASARTLEANLSILGTIAVIAPFIGLFGTVLGIIQAFNDIAKHGKTGIETVGAGVAEALVTTAGGLFVAILAVMAFNYFKSKMKRMNGEMADGAARLGELLYLKQTGTPLPTDLEVEPQSSPREKTKSKDLPRD